MDKISIIVPVYNVEKYLKRALDSLIQQTYNNLEIICINDGSTDNSYKILQEYSELDSRIIVINQKNHGVSNARNRGLSIATGKYIMFLDPDDWYELKAVEKAYNSIVTHDADIVCFGFNFTDGYKVSNDTSYLDALKEYEQSTITNPHYIISIVWNNIFSKKFLCKFNVKFYENLKYCEDIAFVQLCALNSIRFYVLPENLYNYNTANLDSAMHIEKNLIPYFPKYVDNIINSNAFKNVCFEEKVLCVDNTLRYIISFYYKIKGSKYDFLNTLLITYIIMYLKIKTGKILYQCELYKEVKKINIFLYIIKRIFSVKNKYSDKNKSKVIRLLGAKITFKVKNNKIQAKK